MAKLALKLLDDEKYHTKAINFKKVIKLKEAFELSNKLLRHKADNDPILIQDELFKSVVMIYEEQLTLLLKEIDSKMLQQQQRTSDYRKANENI